MIFDYILNNRFYAPDVVEHVDPFVPSGESSNEPPNPYADIIPTAPHNRLETFLNMIIGNFRVPSADYVAADPIKPISEMEYWLNEIAAAKGGNPWKDATGKFVAKKISFDFESTSGEARASEAYSITIDTGLKNIPYPYFVLSGKINDVRVSSPFDGFNANSIVYFDKEISDGELVKISDLRTGSIQFTYGGDHELNNEEVLPGLCLKPSNAVFIKEKGNDATIKLQLLLGFFYNNGDAQEYNNEAKELIFDTIDLKFVEKKNDTLN